MCIAIYKPGNMNLNQDTLQACWDNNPDGAGFMYTENNKLIIKKGYMTYKDFLEAYTPFQDTECVIHFRIGTHGGNTPENTHPFFINKNLGLIHNGIINKVTCDINKDMSDTWHFIEKILNPIIKKSPDIWLDKPFKELIEDFIGQSKCILMDNKNNVTIYGESKGIWNSDCWFSNTSYITRIPYKPWKNPQHQTQNNFDNPNPYNNYNRSVSERFKKKSNQQNTFGLKMGDFALLAMTKECSNPDNLNEVITAGTKVKIEYFSNNLQVCIINPINNKKAMVALWMLDPWEDPLKLVKIIEVSHFTIGEEVIIHQNYNHFRIGDIKEVTSFTKDYVIVKDPETTKKTFALPKAIVTPIKHCLLAN